MEETASIHILGAGQDVGRSCILLQYRKHRVLLDCGVHMVSEQRFPDFNSLKVGDWNEYIDCLIISHFHLDHSGALPYFTEHIGYSGPIIMTAPTRAILPHLLDDFRRVSPMDGRNKGKAQFGQGPSPKSPGGHKSRYTQQVMYTPEMIDKCMNQVTIIKLGESINVNKAVKLKVYYAGHVLGAGIYEIDIMGLKVVYTGDFNMRGDRHLGSARIDPIFTDILITESTYATTLRDSKRTRERNFLKQIQLTIERGGKVLIPVFALGRSQELCILLETHWSRTNNQTPIYFAGGLTDKANFYYRLFINWTNQKLRETFLKNNMFKFRHIEQFDRSLGSSSSPMVVLSTPGMLHGGTSAALFRDWCSNPLNTIIIPGYCSPGTLGARILAGEKRVTLDNKTYCVNCDVAHMSFSAHADSQGIIELINHLQPKNVVVVHGEKEKMNLLGRKIGEQLGIPCFCPPNNSTLQLTNHIVRKTMLISGSLYEYSACLHRQLSPYTLHSTLSSFHKYTRGVPVTGILNLLPSGGEEKIINSHDDDRLNNYAYTLQSCNEFFSDTENYEIMNIYFTEGRDLGHIEVERRKDILLQFSTYLKMSLDIESECILPECKLDILGVNLVYAENGLLFTWNYFDDDIANVIIKQYDSFIFTF